MLRPVLRWLRKIVDVREGEVTGLLWSFVYFLALMTGWYALRPLREAAGTHVPDEHLKWLFTSTFVVMLCVVPIFSALVSRYERRRLIPWLYHFFALNLLAF